MSELNSEDLELLRDTASRFFDEQLPIDVQRKLRDEVDKIGFDLEKWRAMADMGWAGILIDEAHGGIGFGYAALGIIMEQSGRTLAASPFVSTVLLGAQIIASAGNETQQTDILGKVASGDLLLALAHEESSRHTPTQIATRAVQQDANYILNGHKTFVLDGHIADRLIVVARNNGEFSDRDGVSLFLVDASASGVQRKRTILVDGRNAANIEFSNVQAQLVGTIGNAFDVLDPVLDGARAALAAEMLGTGVEAFDRTIEYLKVREQFGAPIGSFQSLKHRAAEMYCEIELTRSSVYAALEEIDHSGAESAQLASIAKAKACDMLELVTNEAVQMHGGIGMTDVADIGLFLKRARVAQQILGDSLYHRERYARLIGL
ncbi:MAG: alkylation response protein AidB-like acyl-CoA dehydrogenase [Gammaproteobacteria bacterium]|jgi:alkylation response protein AidB-like acyl-CoA dehydrogenase